MFGTKWDNKVGILSSIIKLKKKKISDLKNLLSITYGTIAFQYSGITPGIWHNICIAVNCKLRIIKVYIDYELELDKKTFDCNANLQQNIFIFGEKDLELYKSRNVYLNFSEILNLIFKKIQNKEKALKVDDKLEIVHLELSLM